MESTASSNYAFLRGKHLSMSNSVTLLPQPTDIYVHLEKHGGLEGYAPFHRRLATCMVITHYETLQESIQLVLKKIEQQRTVEIHPSGLLFHSRRDSRRCPISISPVISISQHHLRSSERSGAETGHMLAETRCYSFHFRPRVCRRR